MSFCKSKHNTVMACHCSVLLSLLMGVLPLQLNSIPWEVVFLKQCVLTTDCSGLVVKMLSVQLCLGKNCFSSATENPHQVSESPVAEVHRCYTCSVIVSSVFGVTLRKRDDSHVLSVYVRD